MTARVATPDDAGVLFEILSDPNLPNIPERHRPPSEEHLRARLAQEIEAAQVATDDKLLTWAIEREGEIVAALSTDLDLETRYSGQPDHADVRTVEYTAYRRPQDDGHGVVQRGTALIQPILIEVAGVEQAVVTVAEDNEEAAAAIGDYTPRGVVGPDSRLHTRDIESPAIPGGGQGERHTLRRTCGYCMVWEWRSNAAPSVTTSTDACTRQRSTQPTSTPRRPTPSSASLNAHCTDEKLVLAQRLEHPALCGIVFDVEADPAILSVLNLPDNASHRWRQAVGVAIKFAMAALGWTTSGAKRTVVGSQFFTRAEFYSAPGEAGDDGALGAVAAG